VLIKLGIVQSLDRSVDQAAITAKGQVRKARYGLQGLERRGPERTVHMYRFEWFFIAVSYRNIYTVGCATTNESYNEQFLSIKSECYNEHCCYNERGGILLIVESTIIVFTKERLFMLSNLHAQCTKVK
jgi:hypothetical protein